jgi:transcriptional antiterminator NusG
MSIDYTNWYTLRVLSGKENKVKEYLPHVEGYEKQIEEVLIPQEKTIQLRNNKKIVVTKNLLPGYILVKFKKTPDPDFVKLVEKSNFVSAFLRENGKTGRPIPLKENEFNNIVGNVELSKEKVKGYVVGDNIVVTDGPFSTFKGNITEIYQEKKRLKVTVKIFGRDTPVELGFNQVEKDIL